MAAQRPFQAALARERVAQRYMAGTETGSQLEWFVWAALPAVDGARDLRWLRIGQRVGQVRRSTDSKGRVGIAFYERDSEQDARRVSFKRNRRKYPRASRRGFLFLPLPVVWAVLNGLECTHLSAPEFSRWRTSLEEAAGVAKEDALDRAARYRAQEISRCKFPLPPFPNMALPGASDAALWCQYEQARGRRLNARRRWSLSLAAVSFADRFHESMRLSRHGLPRCVPCAASYLGKVINVPRRTAAHVLRDLELVGFVARAMYVSGPEGQRAYYAYLPGTGKPPRGSPARLTERWTAHVMRLFILSARQRAYASQEPSQKWPYELNKVSTKQDSLKETCSNLYGHFQTAGENGTRDLTKRRGT